MKNTFIISLGIAFLVVSVLNVFLDINECVLFSLTLSALIFSIVDLLSFKKMNNKISIIFYTLAMAIMISGMAFSSELMKISIIDNLVNSNLSTIITFLSYGLIFTFEYYKDCERTRKTIEEGYKLSTYQFEIINSIYVLLINHIESLKDSSDYTILRPLTNEIGDYLEDLSLLNQIKSELLDSSSNKSEYSLKQIEDAFKMHSSSFIKMAKKKREMENKLK